MVGRGFNVFFSFLSLSLSANYALARVSNITFSDPPNPCSNVTISWQGGVPPFTVIILQFDAIARPGPEGTIPGNPVQIAEAGNARRLVWPANVKPGKAVVAVVRDGLEQDASSVKRVVQTSRNVNCLAAVTPTDTFTSFIALPSLSTRPVDGTQTVGTQTVGTQTGGTPSIEISSATASPSMSSLITIQKSVIALPVLLTLFTVGIVVGVTVYGLYIYRSSAPRLLHTISYDDIEQGRHEEDTPNSGLQRFGTYSRQLGRGIGRKISALSSQISRRPTVVVATEKPESFTILPEENSPPVPQEMSQPSPGSRADVVEPRSIIGVPIMPVHAIIASRPTSSATLSTASWMTETGTGLGLQPIATSEVKGLRPAPSKSNIRRQSRPLPVPPDLDLSPREPQRQYALPPANSRPQAMRPMNRSKSTDSIGPNHELVSSLPPIRRSVSARVVATLDSPPAHLAQVPTSALPPATPITSSIRPYSQISEHSSPESGTTTQGASSRKRSNTLGSVMAVEGVPFFIDSPTSPHFNQSIDTSGTEPCTPRTIRPNVPRPLVITSSLPRNYEDDHVDPFCDIPQTATTARTRYSMALPESGSLLPASFSAAQDEIVPPIPFTLTPLSMTVRLPSRPSSPALAGHLK